MKIEMYLYTVHQYHLLDGIGSFSIIMLVYLWNGCLGLWIDH